MAGAVSCQFARFIVYWRVNQADFLWRSGVSVKLISDNIAMMLLGVVCAYLSFWLFAAGGVYKKSKQGALIERG